MIIDELDVTIPKGEITVFIGSNGCGKSTLLRSLARLLEPHAGSILLEGSKISSLPTKEIAKQLAILPQGPVAPEGLPPSMQVLLWKTNLLSLRWTC